MKNLFRYIAVLIAVATLINSCNDNAGKSFFGAKASTIDWETEPIRWKMYNLSYSERSGEKLFIKYCAVCHGIEGQGDGFNSFNLDPSPRNLTDSSYMNSVSDFRLKEIITGGGRGTGKSVLMPAYAYTLSDQEINDIVSYIRHLGK